MARPRKDACGPGARERIACAFWDQLERMPRSSITVGTIVTAAQCNRGTFYYYFADLDALAETVVREELFADDGVARAVFGALIEGDAGRLQQRVSQQSLKHMAVAMRAGERRLVEHTVRDEVTKHWERCLCAPGERLEPAARFAINFMVSGILGFIVEASERDDLPCPMTPETREYLRSVSRATLKAVARAQGMTLSEVAGRALPIRLGSSGSTASS